MRFGLFLNTQLLEGDPAASAVDGLERQVELARRQGFEIVMVGQHFLAEPYGMLSPFPLLGRLSSHSGDMQLATGIALAAMLHPVQLAEEAATLDALTRGRFILGMGLGYRDIEFDAFQVPRGQRANTFQAHVSAVARLLDGEAVDVDSVRASLRGASLSLSPGSRPPIWIAANNAKGISRAAQFADAWLINPHARLSTLVEQVDFYRSNLSNFGKTVTTLPLIREAFVAETRAEAYSLARPFLEKKYRTYLQWGQDRALPEEDPLDVAFDQLAEDRFLIGTPDDVAAEIGRYRDDLGADTMIFRVQWPGMQQKPVERCIGLLGSVLRDLGSGSR